MNFDTLALNSGYDPKKDAFGAMAAPLYQTTAYDFGSLETAANRFALRELGEIYSRLTNPTFEALESKIATLENGAAAVSTASGQAALFFAVANLAGAGDNILLSNKVYGGTQTLFTHTMKNFGIEARVFDSDSAEELESLVDKNTKAILFETLSNPQIAVPNLPKIVEVANKHGVVTIADNTVATPALFKPLDNGVDVVVHSASKYISGQGVSIGGLVVAGKKLNEKLVKNERYARFSTPDESYHGLVYADLAGAFDIFTLRIRIGLLRDMGAVLSPFNAWQLLLGLETLGVRMQRHSDNARKVAEFLEAHPKVKSVNYPGLKSSPVYEFVASKFAGGRASGLLSFEVESKEAARRVLNEVKLFHIVANIGDAKSIITHPATTTHQQLSASELEACGISEGLVRLSIGLESAEDLVADLGAALEKA